MNNEGDATGSFMGFAMPNISEEDVEKFEFVARCQQKSTISIKMTKQSTSTTKCDHRTVTMLAS